MSATNSNHDAACMASFRDRLEQCHDWPCEYTFKFIAPADKAEEVQNVLPKAEISTRESKSGKYISFTAEANMESPDKVVEVYRRACDIKGVMAL